MRQTIVAVENAQHVPSPKLAFRIARAFGKPQEEVFHWVDQT